MLSTAFLRLAIACGFTSRASTNSTTIGRACVGVDGHLLPLFGTSSHRERVGAEHSRPETNPSTQLLEVACPRVARPSGHPLLALRRSGAARRAPALGRAVVEERDPALRQKKIVPGGWTGLEARQATSGSSEKRGGTVISSRRFKRGVCRHARRYVEHHSASFRASPHEHNTNSYCAVFLFVTSYMQHDHSLHRASRTPN